MSRYRIIKHQGFYGVSFQVQKRSFLGIWYNFNNFDAYMTGYYQEEAEAREAIAAHRSKTKKTIINLEEVTDV